MDFDPYHKWLGIPKKYRPPTLYQLLGIEPDETDNEVIEEAAIRQTAHLRVYQSGAHAAACARLLEEVARARHTLLNPARRQAYDAQLAQRQARPAPATTQVTAATPAVAHDPFAELADPTAVVQPPPVVPGGRAAGHARTQGRSNAGLWVAVVGCVALLSVGLALAAAFGVFTARERDPGPNGGLAQGNGKPGTGGTVVTPKDEPKGGQPKGGDGQNTVEPPPEVKPEPEPEPEPDPVPPVAEEVGTGLTLQGQLATGRLVGKKYHRVHLVSLKADQNYAVEVQAEGFSPRASLESLVGPGTSEGEAKDAPLARLAYLAKNDGTHRLTVTSLEDGQVGAYALTVKPAAPEPPPPPPVAVVPALKANLVQMVTGSPPDMRVFFGPVREKLKNKPFVLLAYKDLIELRDVEALAPLGRISRPEKLPVHQALCSPDARWLVTGTRAVTVHDLQANARVAFTFARPEPGDATDIDLSPDGTQALICTHGTNRPRRNVHSADLYDFKNGQLIRRFPHLTPVVQGGFGPTNNVVTLDASETVRVWDVPTGMEIRSFQPVGIHATFTRLSPDSALLAAGYERVFPNGPAFGLWEVVSGSRTHEPLGHSSIVRHLSFSGDGKRLATAGGGSRPDPVNGVQEYYDLAVRLWDTATGKALAVLEGPGREVTSLAFSADGRYVAALTEEQKLFLWELPAQMTPAGQ